jgi:hypothetical protein
MNAWVERVVKNRGGEAMNRAKAPAFGRGSPIHAIFLLPLLVPYFLHGYLLFVICQQVIKAQCKQCDMSRFEIGRMGRNRANVAKCWRDCLQISTVHCKHCDISTK